MFKVNDKDVIKAWYLIVLLAIHIYLSTELTENTFQYEHPAWQLNFIQSHESCNSIGWLKRLLINEKYFNLSLNRNKNVKLVLKRIVISFHCYVIWYCQKECHKSVYMYLVKHLWATVEITLSIFQWGFHGVPCLMY